MAQGVKLKPDESGVPDVAVCVTRPGGPSAQRGWRGEGGLARIVKLKPNESGVPGVVVGTKEFGIDKLRAI